MRKPVIAGNWKMCKTIGEAIELANGLKRDLFKLEPADIDIVLCPPFTVLGEVYEVIANSNLRLGAQDLYWEDEGAFTGEISGKMLRDVGCSFVIVGHSERRQYFGETNETVNHKVRAALTHDLTPIMCVGEVLKEREQGLTFQVLDDHVMNGLKGFTADEVRKVVIAYEPVWAIGTGRTASPLQAQESHAHIRKRLTETFEAAVAQEVRIQYGGSVKPENIAELMKQPDVDGALVGGASLQIETFATIVKGAREVSK